MGRKNNQVTYFFFNAEYIYLFLESIWIFQYFFMFVANVLYPKILYHT